MRMDLWRRVGRLSRRIKIAVMVSFDLAALSFALWASYALRYGRWTPPSTFEQLGLLLLAPAMALGIFWWMGGYRTVLRYMSDKALLQLLQALTISVLCWVVLAFLTEMSGQRGVPRSVPLLYWALSVILVIGARLLVRYLASPAGTRGKPERALLIYGSGDAGVKLAGALAGQSVSTIVGFLDDNPNLQGRVIAGIPVHSPLELDELIAQLDIREIIIAIPSLSMSRRMEIVARISRPHVTIRTVPPLLDWVNGQLAGSQVRDIDLDELLGRSEVPPEPALLRVMIEGRNILVTGAGGSIGSELCRLIVKWSPASLVLLEANEFALYQIARELGDGNTRIVPVLGSITDEPRVREAVTHYRADVIFHAAAHKHVPLLERNVLEGARNNVFGTQTLAQVAFEAGVRSFVLISSDKAVRPTNVMGATKRWAELIVYDYSQKARAEQTGQSFCSVRFGNVLGSNGSVVPLFKEQIAKGGPITLTDDRMTRYFMSIHEAAELIVQAGALSEGGDTFLLDMGEPVRIRDLAENMVFLSGLRLKTSTGRDGDIEIVTVGSRPGEKLFEELFYDDLAAEPTRHSKIKRASIHPADLNMQQHLTTLGDALARRSEEDVRSVLFGVIKTE